MDWEEMPVDLKLYSFKDFCIRHNEVYDAFWGYYAPFFDIAIYRDYLLYDVVFSDKPDRQRNIAGVIWEFLMGDLEEEELLDALSNLRVGGL